MGTQYSTGPFLSVFEIHYFGETKSVSDNGRPVFLVPALEAQGEWSSGEFSSGSATCTLSNRDNYPLIEVGDVIHAYVNNSLAVGGKQTVATFIVETVDIDLLADTVVYSGPGLGKEFQKKLLALPFISNEYSGTSGLIVDNYIYLDDIHQQVDDFYNGGVLYIKGAFADIVTYEAGNNWVIVENWRPEIENGDTELYTIYHGKSLTDIQKVTANTQTWWLSNVNGTTNGSFINVNGRTCQEIMDDIAEDTGWRYVYKIGVVPNREIWWFDPNATPNSSQVQLKRFSDTSHAELLANIDYGPVINCTRTSSSREGVTRFTVATKEALTLAGLTLSDVVLPTGFNVNFGSSTITNTAAEAGHSVPEIVERTHVFNNIVAPNDTAEGKKQTQVQLFNATITLLRTKDPRNYTFNVRTKLNRDFRVGQTAHLKYIKSILGEIQFSVDQDLWIRRIACDANAVDGVRFMDVELGEYFLVSEKDPYKTIAKSIKEKSSQNAGQIIITGKGDTGVTDHGFLAGLQDDDHPHYLKADGTRTLAGDMLVSPGKKIDTVDISVHKASYDAHVIDIDAHHDLVDITSSSPVEVLTLSGQSLSFLLNAGNGLAFSGATLGIDLSTNSGLEFLSNKLQVALAANSGLKLLNNELLIDLASNSGLQLIGNDLSLGLPSTLSATGSSNQVLGASHSHDVTTVTNAAGTPGHIIAGDAFGDIQVRDFQARSVGINTPPTGVSGIAMAGNLDMTGTITLDGNIDFTGSHSISVNGGGKLSIIPEGVLELTPGGGSVKIDASLDFQGPQTITTLTGQLTIDPYLGLTVVGNAAFGSATDTTNAAIKAIASTDTDYALYLKQRTNQDAYIFKIEAADTTDALLVITKEGDLESGSPGFVTGTTGWQITHEGHAEFWSAKIRGELHATVFSADEVSSANGQLMVITSGVVDSPTNLPSAIGLTYIINVTASVATGFCPFVVNDILLTQFMSSGGAGLDVWEVYSEVDVVGAIVGRDLPNDEPGYFPLTCTWRVGGEAGLEIPAPLAIVKWGTVSGSGLEGGIVMAADDPVNSPYLQVFTLPSAHTWGGAPIKTPRVHMGNLNGVMALGDEWGIAMAQDLSSTADENPSVVVGSGGVKLRNVDQMVYDSSGNPRVLIASDGNVKFGTDVGGAATTMFHFDPSAGSLTLRDTNLKTYNGGILTGELTSTGYFKLGSNIAVAATTMIDFNPITGSLLLRDTNLNTYNGAIQTGALLSTGELKLGTNLSSSDTTTFHVYESGSVTIGRYPNGAYMYWDNNGSVLKLQKAELEMYNGAIKTVDMSPSGDVFFGSNASTHSSISFAHYGASGDVRIGNYVSGQANMFWDQSAGDLIIRNYTTPMIIFKGSTGNSFFAGRMDIGSATYPNGKIVATYTTMDKDGIEIITTNASSYEEKRGYTFVDASGNEMSGLYGKYYTTDVSNSIRLSTKAFAGKKGRIDILSYGGSTLHATATLKALANAGAGQIVSVHLDTYDNEIVLSAGTVYAEDALYAYGDLTAGGGIRAGSSADVTTGNIEASADIMATSGLAAGRLDMAPGTGVLLLNQGTGTSKIIEIRSTSFSGMTTQGMNHTNNFGQIHQVTAGSGGLAILGAGSSYNGLWLEGSSNLAGALYSPVNIRGNIDNGKVADGSPLLVVQNSYNGSRLVVRGNGDLYVFGGYNTFDHLASDVEMVRAHSLLSPHSIRSRFDEMVRYNRRDLLAADLIEDVPHGYLVNTTGMMRLHSGALWQLHQRIAELEEDISFGTLVKMFFKKVFQGVISG